MSNIQDTPLNPLAQNLNEILSTSAPEVFEMLSGYGRRIYFPKGILTQSAEAAARAHRFNATIGIATEDGAAMHLPSMASQLPNLKPDDAFRYAPAAGRPKLRELWQEKLLAENPHLVGRKFGLPIVTAAITHGLALVGDLFVDAGDCIVIPDQLWGNYRLNFEVRLGAELLTFPFYAQSGFNCDAFAETLQRAAEHREKVTVLLNFPDNPTGYMPTRAEAEAIVSTLLRQAERGTRLVVILDDAYFGLFYELDNVCATESVFSFLPGLHPNLLAIKLDGATKELFVWGLRCGFITFGPGRSESADAVCEALEAKVKGAIRAGVSNVPQLSQTLVENALLSSSLPAEREQKVEILRHRAQRVHEVAWSPRFTESWDVYPFNSGYFMCLKIKGVEAETLRQHLLDQYGVGLIATSASDIRVAFSCLESGDIEPLFEIIHQAVQELV